MGLCEGKEMEFQDISPPELQKLRRIIAQYITPKIGEPATAMPEDMPLYAQMDPLTLMARDIMFGMGGRQAQPVSPYGTYQWGDYVRPQPSPVGPVQATILPRTEPRPGVKPGPGTEPEISPGPQPDVSPRVDVGVAVRAGQVDPSISTKVDPAQVPNADRPAPPLADVRPNVRVGPGVTVGQVGPVGPVGPKVLQFLVSPEVGAGANAIITAGPVGPAGVGPVGGAGPNVKIISMMPMVSAGPVEQVGQVGPVGPALPFESLVVVPGPMIRPQPGAIDMAMVGIRPIRR